MSEIDAMGGEAASGPAEGPSLGYVGAVTGSTVTGLLGGGPANDAGIQIGVLLKMRTAKSVVYGTVSELTLTDASTVGADSTVVATIELDGEVIHREDGSPGDVFRRGVSVCPMLGTAIHAITRQDMERVYAAPSVPSVRIGAVHQDESLPAHLMTDGILGKHFAVLGTTGSGKSSTVALILHSILEAHPYGRVVLLDPHNEYATAFQGMAHILDPSNLELPYWLLNFEEIMSVVVGAGSANREADVAILKSTILQARRRYNQDDAESVAITVDTPVPYRYGDLIKILDEALGKSERAESTAPYLRLKSRLDDLRSDTRFSFMFSGYNVADSMADTLSKLLRIPVADKPITIVDLSGVPSEIVDAVVSVLCRMIFDFALWCVRPQAFPVLLVCEEAHRYVPAAGDGFGPTRRSIARIAKEGRKYGVSLGLVSQRPSELDSTILTQCNTIVALRMGNERDRKFVADAMPDGSAGLLESLPALRVGEALVVGDGVTMPMRVRLDALDASVSPRSSTASYAAAWNNDVERGDIVELTVDRWRRQVRDRMAGAMQGEAEPAEAHDEEAVYEEAEPAEAYEEEVVYEEAEPAEAYDEEAVYEEAEPAEAYEEEAVYEEAEPAGAYEEEAVHEEAEPAEAYEEEAVYEEAEPAEEYEEEAVHEEAEPADAYEEAPVDEEAEPAEQTVYEDAEPAVAYEEVSEYEQPSEYEEASEYEEPSGYDEGEPEDALDVDGPDPDEDPVEPAGTGSLLSLKTEPRPQLDEPEPAPEAKPAREPAAEQPDAAEPAAEDDTPPAKLGPLARLKRLRG